MMMRRLTKYFSVSCLLIALALTSGLLSCKKTVIEEQSFIKVYDDADLSKNYYPLSIKSSNDGGYVILSAYNGTNIHLLKSDALGDIVWEYDLPNQYTNALPNLMERNGNLYFVCMDAVGLFTYVMYVDESAQNATEYQVFQDILYPLAVTDNDDAVYIQNYERLTFETGIYALNTEMDQILASNSIDIFVDVEQEINEHINYTGKRFPFYVSSTPEQDFVLVNGFNNYSFSAVFLNPNLDFSGVYNGAAFDGGFNAIQPLGGNNFALSRFSFSDVYFNSNVALSPTAIEISESVPAEWKSELDANSPVLIKNLSIKGTDFTVFLATTKSNQIVLEFYKQGTTELAGSKYIGESVPLKACDLLKMESEDLVILMQATVMSSFNRVAVVKLTALEIETLLGLN